MAQNPQHAFDHQHPYAAKSDRSPADACLLPPLSATAAVLLFGIPAVWPKCPGFAGLCLADRSSSLHTNWIERPVVPCVSQQALFVAQQAQHVDPIRLDGSVEVIVAEVTIFSAACICRRGEPYFGWRELLCSLLPRHIVLQARYKLVARFGCDLPALRVKHASTVSCRACLRQQRSLCPSNSMMRQPHSRQEICQHAALSI